MYRVVVFLALLCLYDGCCWSRPVDLSAPGGELGAANPKGYLEIWREIEDVGLDFGSDSFLPLRYKFSSDNTSDGMLGVGFYMPMLEAKNTLIRESTMRACLPCGKGLYFWRSNVDQTKFQTVDKEWTGALSLNGDFTAWRDDGWIIFYHQGKLRSMTTDQRHVYIWNYDANNHIATGIDQDGRSLVKVEANQQGRVNALVFDQKRYELTYSERPIVEVIMGRSVVKELVVALSGFKYPDGKSESFKFEMSQEGVPNLTLNDLEQKQTIYTWDASSGHIISEKGEQGDWNYKIGQIAQDFGFPPISRTKNDGKAEALTVDNKMGTYTLVNADGTTTVSHVFEGPGRLYQKVKQIELVEPSANGPVSFQVYRASYDETGKLIREVDENGWVTNFVYDEKGMIKSKSTGSKQEPEVVEKLNNQKTELIKKVQQASSRFAKDGALEQLAYFYMTRMRDIPDALSLVADIADRDIAFNVKFNAVCDNKAITRDQKLNELKALMNIYPEKQDFLMSFSK